MAVKKDLSETRTLKRTGRVGEIVTDDYRKANIKAAEKIIKQNKPAGIIVKSLSESRATPELTRKNLKTSEADKIKVVAAAKNRISELKARKK